MVRFRALLLAQPLGSAAKSGEMAAMATATAKALCRVRRFTGYPSSWGSSGSLMVTARDVSFDRPAMVASHPRIQGVGHRPLLSKLNSRKRTQGEFKLL